MATAPKTAASIRFAAFEFDVRAGELRKHGIRLPIQGRPLEVLALLLEQPGQIVTREEVRHRLWPADTFVDFDHSLHNAIARLREALGDSAEAPRFIETLPRRGYRFVGRVEGSHGAPQPKGASPATPVRRLRFLAMTLLLLAAVVVGGAWFYRHSQGAKSAPQIHSIAVLPLVNLSGDPSQEYFADGMTDELITELAQIGSLRVISRTSVMRYKGTSKPSPLIAKELGVDAVLEGSVARSGNRVRITAQLIEASTDRHLWADNYEGEAKDVLEMQDAVAREVAKQIQLRLTPAEQVRLSRARSVNPEAHEAYLKGLYYWDKRDRASLWKAIEYFNRAIAIDPNYALPYAALAESYVPLSYIGDMKGTEAREKVMATAGKALELDPSLAEAHTALGSAKSYYDYDWDGGENEFRQAIALNPSYATAHSWYAQLLSLEGREDEALRETKRAMQLDPLSLIIRQSWGFRLYLMRRYDEAAAYMTTAGMELDPDFSSTHWDLGLVYEGQRNFEAAVKELEKADVSLRGNALVLGEMGYAYAASGDKARARAILRRLQEQSQSEYVDPYAFALVYTGLGEKDMAFLWLDRAITDRDCRVTFLKVEPELDSLRTDPRFVELVRRVKLSP